MPLPNWSTLTFALAAWLLLFSASIQGHSQVGQEIEGLQGFESFGAALSISADGNILAVGAPGYSQSFTSRGQVRVYQWSAPSWVQLGNSINGQVNGDQSGSAVSLSGDGLRIAIASPASPGDPSRVRVYEFSGGDWAQLGSDIVAAQVGSGFGASLSLSNDGSVLAIGAPNAPGEMGLNTGQVRVFAWAGNAWTQVGNSIYGDSHLDDFGHSVSLTPDGNDVAVGAPRNSSAGFLAGQAKVFSRTGLIWMQVGDSIFGESGVQAGAVVSLSDDANRVAVLAAAGGFAQIYEWNGSSWGQVGSQLGVAPGHTFGYSLSLKLSGNGEIVAFGDGENDDNGFDSGNVRLFKWTGAVWRKLGDSIVGETNADFFGSAIALSNDGLKLASGAPGHSGAIYKSGQARVFDINPVLLPVYVALGDSYASGEGAGNYLVGTDVPSNRCHRSLNVWSGLQPGADPGQVAGEESSDRINVACSGAQLKHMRDEEYWEEGPQFYNPAVVLADIVTVSIGGNDVLFEKVLNECFLPHLTLHSCDSEEFIPSGEPTPLRTQVDSALARLASTLDDNLVDLKRIAASDAQVFVFNYPQLFGDTPLCGGFTPSERLWMNEVADQVSETIECAAAKAQLNFVDVRPYFSENNNRQCDKDTSYINWIRPFNMRESFHPNKSGQIAYASALSYALDNSEVPPLSVCPEVAAGFESPMGEVPQFASGSLSVSAMNQNCASSFAPTQVVSIEGLGFIPSVEIDVWVEGELYSSLIGSFTADNLGNLSEQFSLPTDAPTSGFGIIKAIGLSFDGASLSLYGTFHFAESATTDSDLDGIPDSCDVCPNSFDPDQSDTDQDGVGDACDACPLDSENDIDNDGICGDVDYCPVDSDNDSDGDGLCRLLPGNDPCISNPNLGCSFESGFESTNAGS